MNLFRGTRVLAKNKLKGQIITLVHREEVLIESEVKGACFKFLSTIFNDEWAGVTFQL